MNIGIKAAVVAAASVGALALGVAPAFASTGPTSNHVNAKQTGQFAANYVDPYFGQVKVNETHHGGTLPGNFDTLGATLANPDVADEGQTITLPWISDFGTTFDQNQGYITVTVSADGLSYSGNAYYPAG